MSDLPNEAVIEMIDNAAQAERAAIVAWLRSNPGLLVDLPSPDDGPFTQQDKTVAFVRQSDASAIESGEHLRGDGRG